ncbi:hypothetical protein EB796_017948 [Bugula neritina]|uniref:Uncharacterized protein n=1 Tax=Bugula neritina TaxID=10212 RepID=A0A7J7JDM3_BUGNE|nr:hypothetical protein EB796_017948 [Bugula neritina]
MAAYCFAFFIMLGMFGACWAGCVREEMFFTDIVIKCSGEDVTSIPSNLDTNLQRLLVENTGIQEIDETTLAPYTNLRSVLITRNSHLAKLSGHIFSKNFLLSDIKITHNSQLSQIHPSTFDGVFKRGFRVL